MPTVSGAVARPQVSTRRTSPSVPRVVSMSPQVLYGPAQARVRPALSATCRGEVRPALSVRPAQIRKAPVPRARAESAAAPAPTNEVAVFLHAHGLQMYALALEQNGFDELETLMCSEDADMLAIGLPEHHVAQLRRALKTLEAGKGAEDGRRAVLSFLEEIGLGRYGEALIAAGFDDMETLSLIEANDMKDLNIARGHALKLERKLREREARHSKPAPTTAGPSTAEAPKSARPHYQPSEDMLPTCEMKTAVEQSWEQVRQVGVDVVAEMLYRHTFQLAPAAMGLFPPEVRHRYRDWAVEEDYPEEREDNLIGSPALCKLFMKILNAVGGTVAGLHDMGKLVPMVLRLGERHIGYGTAEAHWPVLGQALELTLQDVLGASFTGEVRRAWATVYLLLSTLMIEGLRKAIAEQKQMMQGSLEVSLGCHQDETGESAESTASTTGSSRVDDVDDVDER